MARASSPYLTLVKDAARKLGKARGDKAHALVYEALKIAALAGDADAARPLVDAMYGGLPPAKKVLTALATHAIDGLCHATGFGDLTGGKPTFAHALAADGPLAQRVADAERGMRYRLTASAYAGAYPQDDAWRDRPRDDPWFAIDRFRRVQLLLHPDHVTPAREREALTRLRELLADWPLEERGPGGGSELVLALELGLRLRADDDVRTWLSTHGARVHAQKLAEPLLCLPAVATALAAGLLRPLVVPEPAELARAFAAVTSAVTALRQAAPSTSARPTRPPKVQKRRVSCEYAQVHLEPATLTAAEQAQTHFQDPRESAQGMSLFPTMVGLATPSETAHVDVAVVIAAPGSALAPLPADAVQAVAFPIVVRDRLRLRGVSDDDDEEPLSIPPGRYDVLAVFTPGKRPRRADPTALRTFALHLAFHTAGTLAAPRCLRLDDGTPPPTKIVANS